MLGNSLIEPTKDDVISALKQCHTERFLKKNLEKNSPLTALKPAGVLVPLFYKQGKLHLLLTKRSMHVSSHQGETCFPGGRMDATDEDEIEASMREAWEEIGLNKSNIEVIATLPPVISRVGHLVNPTVAFIPNDFTPKINQSEVAEVFSLPVERFLRSRGHSVFRRHHRLGVEVLVPIFEDTTTETATIHKTFGLTAYLCICLAVILYCRETEFEISPGVKMSPKDVFYVSNLQLASTGLSNQTLTKTKL